MRLKWIERPEQLEALIEEIGFLPLFRSDVPGFSLEDMTPRELWFQEGVTGPWEWREMLCNKGEVAYGKVFHRKAGFVSRAWLPDLVNFRRDGLDLETLYEEGWVRRSEKHLYDVLCGHFSLLTHDLKRECGLTKGYDTAILSLQMRAFVTICGIERRLNKQGQPYGWSTSRFAPMDFVFGEALTTARFDDPPGLSGQRLMDRVRAFYPEATDKQLQKLLAP